MDTNFEVDQTEEKPVRPQDPSLPIRQRIAQLSPRAVETARTMLNSRNNPVDRQTITRLIDTAKSLARNDLGLSLQELLETARYRHHQHEYQKALQSLQDAQWGKIISYKLVAELQAKADKARSLLEGSSTTATAINSARLTKTQTDESDWLFDFVVEHDIPLDIVRDVAQYFIYLRAM